MEKKRLKKDLPFGGLKAETVLTKCVRGFVKLLGDGEIQFSKAENEILSKIWDDEEWFEPAIVDVLKIKVFTSKIEFQFKSLDLEDAQTLARGIVFCLEKHFGKDGNYIWNKFKFRIES